MGQEVSCPGRAGGVQRKALMKALLEVTMDEDGDEEEEGKGVGFVKEQDQ